MRVSRSLLILAAMGIVACGPTYVVQSPPQPAPQRVPPPPRVQPLEVNIVRPEDGRVLIQTSRPAYVAVFEIIPGRGVSLVYPAPYRPRDIMLTGLTWVNVYWTMRPDYDRRYASSDTRFIYAVASDTPLRISDDDYDRDYLQRELGAAYWSSSPNVVVRAISREFVRAQPDEWWGEDMYSMPVATPRITVTIRLARVYCPGGTYFEVREEMADHIWCPTRVQRSGERPVALQPDSVFGSNGRRLPRRFDPSNRTPVFRVPTEVGEQQGQPTPHPRDPSTDYPRTQPPLPGTSQPQNQPQTQSQNPTAEPNGRDKDHQDNGRRAHGDPRDADPRGKGNGYGNGGRDQPTTQSPANPQQSNPQPQQQGQPQGQSQTQPGNGHQDHGNSNPANSPSGNPGNSGDHGNGADNAKPDHDNPPKGGVSAILKARGPQGLKQDDKKAATDSTDKKKP